MVIKAQDLEFLYEGELAISHNTLNSNIVFFYNSVLMHCCTVAVDNESCRVCSGAIHHGDFFLFVVVCWILMKYYHSDTTVFSKITVVFPY